MSARAPRQTAPLRRRPARLFLAGTLVGALASANAGAQSPEPPATAAPVPATPAPFADADEPIEILDDALELIEREHIDGGVTREELVEAAMRGIVDHLNKKAVRAGQPPVNALLTRREVGRLADSLSGEVTGIGVLAQPVPEGGIEVQKVFANSPAVRAGIQPGDRIAAIDGYPVSGLEAFALLRGADSAPVRLQVYRAGAAPESAPIEVKVVRSRYRVSTVHSAVLDGGDVGYVSLGSLSRGSAEDVAGALLDFTNAGNVWAVVLDLRGNRGGSLQEARRIAEMFVDPGKPLFCIQTKSEEQVINASGEVLWAGEVSVLVDGGTASAAEALAAALQLHRAYLIGERTAGRGLGESIFPLPTGGALRLATAQYKSATPDGKCHRSWIGNGLKPDSNPDPLVVDPAEPFDPQLRNALTIMQKGRPVRAPLDGTPTLLR